MNILFFQNIISPHQMPYIEHLPKMEGVDNVVVIVPEVNLGERDALGWDANRWLQTEGVKFVVAPSIEEVERIFRNVNENENENEKNNVDSGAVRNGAMLLRNADATKRCRYEKEKSVIGYRLSVIDNGNVNVNGNQGSVIETQPSAIRHQPSALSVERLAVSETQPSAISHQPSTVNQTWCLFSGINAFPAVAEWFRISLKYQVKRGVITEPPYIYDHPLWQHAIRFALKDWRYVKYIAKIFVMGDDYLDYYRFWSKRWEVIPFMYCTQWRERKTAPATGGDKLKVLYVGSLSHRKNVQCLLKAASLLGKEEQERMEIGIVGDGDERGTLERLVKDMEATVRFHGTQPMERIPEIMEQYDVLVLSSLHDGWGAVVNEALTLGLYVVCSDHCGAKMLLKNPMNGTVFMSDNAQDLMLRLRESIRNRIELRSQALQRIRWSRENISGEAVSLLFRQSL